MWNQYCAGSCQSFKTARVLPWETHECVVLAHSIDDVQGHSQGPLIPARNRLSSPPAGTSFSLYIIGEKHRIQGKGSKCLSPTRCNKCLSRFSDSRSMHGWRSLQSAQSKDFITTDFVYMRAPTKKVELNKHTAAQVITHFSSEYGFTKSGITPGGGRMLGKFAIILASAISSNMREYWVELRRGGTKSDADYGRKTPKRLFRAQLRNWSTISPSWPRGNTLHFNWLAGWAADNLMQCKPSS